MSPFDCDRELASISAALWELHSKDGFALSDTERQLIRLLGRLTDTLTAINRRQYGIRDHEAEREARGEHHTVAPKVPDRAVRAF